MLIEKALTQEQWFEKIRGWFPSWFISREVGQTPVVDGVFYSIAKLAATAQLDAYTELERTYIGLSTGLTLEIHGSERQIPRLPLEDDATYRVRIQTFATLITKDKLENYLNSFLPNGKKIVIKENYIDGPWASGLDEDATFFNNGQMLTDNTKQYNYFSVYIPPFLNGGSAQYFTDFHTSFVASIETNKPLGTAFEILSEASKI